MYSYSELSFKILHSKSQTFNKISWISFLTFGERDKGEEEEEAERRRKRSLDINTNEYLDLVSVSGGEKK